MTEPVSSTADVPALLTAADHLERQAHEIKRILDGIGSRAGHSLLDRSAYGVGDGVGDDFYGTFSGNYRQLCAGVNGWHRAVLAMADGVRETAEMYKRADERAVDRASGLERAMTTGPDPVRNEAGGVTPGRDRPAQGGGGHRRTR